MDRIKIQLQGRDFGRDLFLFYFWISTIPADFLLDCCVFHLLEIRARLQYECWDWIPSLACLWYGISKIFIKVIKKRVSIIYVSLPDSGYFWSGNRFYFTFSIWIRYAWTEAVIFWASLCFITAIRYCLSLSFIFIGQRTFTTSG